MLDEKFSVSLNNREIVYLASVLGYRELIGMENPFLTLSQEQLRSALTMVQQGLEEKQFIEVGFDGSIVLDQLIYGIVHTCCNCSRYILASMPSQEIHYYIGDYLIVEIIFPTEETGECTVSVLPEVKNILDSIMEYCPTNPAQVTYRLHETVVPAELLEQAKTLAIEEKGLDGAVKLMTDKGLTPEDTVELARMMLTNNEFLVVLLADLKNGIAVEVSELVFIKSENRIWRVNFIQEGSNSLLFEFVPCVWEQASEAISGLLAGIETTVA